MTEGCEEIQSQLDDATQQLSEANGQVSTLTGQLNAAQHDIATKNQEIGNLQNQLDQATGFRQIAELGETALQQKADDFFARYPGIDTLYMATDGTAFLNIDDAHKYIANSNLSIETFNRD